MNEDFTLSLSVVLPAYNEEENIDKAAIDAVNFCETNPNVSSYEVIIVNDGSMDTTLHHAYLLQEKYPHIVKIVNHEINKGYGTSVRDGISAASKEWIFFTDSDGQFDIKELSKFIQHTDEYDLIVGKRIKRKDKFIRKLNAGMFNFAIKIGYGIKVKDIDCAFKLFRKSIFETIPLISEGAMINTELMYKAQLNKFRIKQLNVHHYERVFGTATGGDPKVIIRAMKEFFYFRYLLLKNHPNLAGINSIIVGVFTTIIVLAATYWSYSNHYILLYGDAVAHLNLSRRVIDSLTPGLSQIGGVWLPLPHILMLPFVWNDFLWHSGLAGSIISGLSLIWAAVIIYKFAYLVTRNLVASYIAPLVVVTNPNILYLSTTPMSEVLLFSLVTSSLYFFIKWLFEEDLASLVFAAFFGVGASLARYDGWLLICIEIAIILLKTIIIYRSRKKAEALTIIYGVLAFLGVGMWLLWNKLIFNNVLYFANSDYGSKAQQMWFYTRGYLPTFHNLGLSVLYYAADVWLVFGSGLLILLMLGLIVYFKAIVSNLGKIKGAHLFNILGLLILFFSFIFYTVSLYSGQASLILPIFAKSWYKWDMSNVRYGIQALLPAGIFISLLAARNKMFPYIVAAVVILQSLFIVQTHQAIVFLDGYSGLSSQRISKGPDAPPVEQWIAKNYDNGLVLMDDYRRPIDQINSKVPLYDYISVGNKPYWQESLSNPTKYSKWIILQQANTDAVWTGMKNKQILNDHYAIVYKSGNIWVYKKRDEGVDFVRKAGQDLVLSNKPFSINGANIYNLLSLSKNEVITQLSAAKSYNINVVRTWAFNKNGNMTPDDFNKLDFVVTEANRRDIRLTLVLGNQWDDFGGRANFTNGLVDEEKFYTDTTVRSRYESYIKKVLTHTNQITNVQYKDEPSIMTWELINEPRMESDSTGGNIAEWTEKVGEYVLNIDRKHLLSIGTEGFITTNTHTNSPYHENHGADYTTLCQLQVIDICSAHLYPKYFGVQDTGKKADATDNNVPVNTLESIVAQWQSIAETSHKPFYLGEVGFDLVSKTKANNVARETFITNVASIVKRKKIAGGMLWNIDITSDNHYSLSFNNLQDLRVIIRWSNPLTTFATSESADVL